MMPASASNADPPMLAFHGVTVRFGSTWALRSVDLEIPRGQFCVVLGPSGSGKSTLLRLVSGAVWADEGEVWFDGQRLHRRGIRQVRRRLAVVPQQFGLTPRLTVLDNVLCGALAQTPLLRSLWKIYPRDLKRRACRLLAEVGLGEEHVTRRARQLSGGQQQRVAIARAFLMRPAVVTADEPVASLDPETARRILGLLRQTCRDYEATLLCSLHQVELAREFADRIIGLEQGRVVFDGRPDQLDDRVHRRIYAGSGADPEPRPLAAPVPVLGVASEVAP